MNYSAIILAAGSGFRTGLTYNKILHKIHRKRVLDYSIDFFKNHNNCTQIVLVCSEDDLQYMSHEYDNSVDVIVIGGQTRQDSCSKGLNKADNDYVLVHDSARPFINPTCIDQLLDEVVESKAATLAIPVSDTIVIAGGNRLTKALDRSSLVALQTPQAFLTKLLLKAHKKAQRHSYLATDDTDLIRKYTNVVPTYVEGDYRSVKLTTKEDIALLEAIL